MIFGGVLGAVGGYYTQAANMGQLERRVQDLQAGEDKVRSDVASLNQHVSVLEAKLDTAQSQIVDLKSQVRLIGDQLGAITEKANTALAQASRRPPDLLTQKCEKLVEEAATGQTDFGWSSESRQIALSLMDKLGCKAGR